MSIRKPLIMMALAAALIAPAGVAAAKGRDDDHGRAYEAYKRDGDHDRGRDRDRGREHGDRDRDRDRGRDHGGKDRDHDRDYGRRHDHDRDRVIVVRPSPRPDPRAYSHGYNNGFHDGVRFADRDRYRVRDWYVRYPSYYRRMPPGHYRQLVRGGYLPRGYYYQAPPVLVRELQPLPRGYGYYVVDRDIVIAAVATGLILDVLLAGN